MSHKLVAFSDSIEKWTNFIINFGFIKGGIGGALRAPPANKYHPKSPRKLGLKEHLRTHICKK